MLFTKKREHWRQTGGRSGSLCQESHPLACPQARFHPHPGGKPLSVQQCQTGQSPPPTPGKQARLPACVGAQPANSRHLRDSDLHPQARPGGGVGGSVTVSPASRDGIGFRAGSRVGREVWWQFARARSHAGFALAPARAIR
jgi:hypothetical protein